MIDLAVYSEILPDGKSLGGVLESIESVGDGLARISVSGRKRCVPEELPLKGLVSKRIVVNHLAGRWGCGAV